MLTASYSQKRRRKGNDTTLIELQNINYWSTQIPYNNNRLDATIVLTHYKTKKAHAISKKSYKFKQELNIRQK